LRRRDERTILTTELPRLAIKQFVSFSCTADAEMRDSLRRQTEIRRSTAGSSLAHVFFVSVNYERKLVMEIRLLQADISGTHACGNTRFDTFRERQLAS
jgi:hypothetical protein